VNEAALKSLLAHPYFAAPAPKSLDRNAFSRAAVSALSTEDAAATLTAFTARSLALSLRLLPAAPRLAIACGGGARNPALMAALRAALPCDVEPASAIGWNGDAIEAQAFAYLAVRALEGLPLTFPTTTGAPAPLTGGIVSRPG
jgi:anhydro-N-acetylmuramic acid kinase